MKKQQIKQNKKSKQTKICAKCGSTDITWDYGNAWVVGYGMNRDCCNNCGLKGNFPTVEADKINDFRRMLKAR